jgi:hypothetical protein
VKRRTLDLIIGVGCGLLAVLVLTIGLIVQSNVSFANDYVRDQLSEQHISFLPVDELTDEEAASDCLVAFAGQSLTSERQAECFASEFIGLHLQSIADGATHADLGQPQMDLQDRVDAAKEANDPDVEALQAQLDKITEQRDTLFEGETSRGLLLTTFGFSQFADKGAGVATAAYIAAALLALLSAAGLIHALVTPKSVPFAPTEDTTDEADANEDQTKS